MSDRERRFLWLLGLPVLLTGLTAMVLLYSLPEVLGFELLATHFGLYASLAAAFRAIALTLRADDVGELETERTTIAFALVISASFISWRLIGSIWLLAKAAS